MFDHELPEFIPASVGIGTIRSQFEAARMYSRLFLKGRIRAEASAEKADRWFLATLLALYGRNNFKRGNLDAGRLNRLFGREIVPADAASFDAMCADAELRIEYGSALAYLEIITKQERRAGLGEAVTRRLPENVGELRYADPPYGAEVKRAGHT